MSNKFTVTMLILIFASITSFSSPRELEKSVTDYSTRLELTEDQIDEIKPVIEKSAVERKAILKQLSVSDKKREKRKLEKELKKVEEKTDKNLVEILDSDQAKEWKVIRKEVTEKSKV